MVDVGVTVGLAEYSIVCEMMFFNVFGEIDFLFLLTNNNGVWRSLTEDITISTFPFFVGNWAFPDYDSDFLVDFFHSNLKW